MKSLFASKTFWLAILQAVGGIAAASTSADPTTQTVGAGAIIKSIVDIALRMTTKEPVTVSK